jgi:hypothetical protein
MRASNELGFEPRKLVKPGSPLNIVSPRRHDAGALSRFLSPQSDILRRAKA